MDAPTRSPPPSPAPIAARESRTAPPSAGSLGPTPSAAGVGAAARSATRPGAAHTHTPGMERAMRKGHDGTPRAPSTEMEDVLADLGPHVGAAARSLLVALRDAHLLQGAAAPELVEVCRDAEARLARYRRAPSNAARSGPPPRP